MKHGRLLFLFVLVGLISSCSMGKKASGSNSSDNGWYRTVSGDISVYQKDATFATANGSKRGGSYSVTFYRIQKGQNGSKLSFTPKNLIPMLDSYAPALDLVKKYKRSDIGLSIWRGIGYAVIVGGLVMVGIGAGKASKDSSTGGNEVLSGFGYIIGSSLTFIPLGALEKNNFKKMLKAVDAYNSRVK